MDPASEPEQLSPRELEALGSAAAWYAKYHARMIADAADDPSAAALADRERYLSLLSGLEKLGFRVRNPLAQITTEVEREAA